MTLRHPRTAAKPPGDLADLLVADIERQLPRLEHQPSPVHDAGSAAGFHH